MLRLGDGRAQPVADSLLAMTRRIWLVGMMGAGKTSVAFALADRLDEKWADSDALIVERAGLSITEIFEAEGESGFRAVEEAVLAELAVSDIPIIATGGGAVTSGRNITTMRASGTVVWLSAPPDVLGARVGAASARPLLAEGVTVAQIGTLLEIRRTAYAAAAHLTLETVGDDMSRVVDRLEALWLTL